MEHVISLLKKFGIAAAALYTFYIVMLIIAAVAGRNDNLPHAYREPPAPVNTQCSWLSYYGITAPGRDRCH